YASRYPCGSVIQPSKLGCATLTLHGFDTSRHRLHFGHAQASLSATLDLHAVHLTKAVFRGTLICSYCFEYKKNPKQELWNFSFVSRG
ncbi:MAG: hypothetical protein M0P13_01580, partial [Fibrobacteraceae bacterium]|nr:hypothetical protein [Fibrobacteraceae bacterium]